MHVTETFQLQSVTVIDPDTGREKCERIFLRLYDNDDDSSSK